ncbi:MULTISPECIES: GntR family transcriptional regulator [Acetobacter]|uniref:GntR family transcriptional regulator n=1 Tax=Acetobacter sacchari TaxID=2661687 RepID=A0ABS3LRI6_9PROT|nr:MULTISPECIES: GntR family transcriptional regulator [Acetobacter]MBO1358509.1 GntR family transcriptional regulator [Acetobacter sacchari]
MDLFPPSEGAAPDSLARTAYTRLLSLLLSGELAPGDLIQERRLADWQELSRTPVRDALNRLEAERLLTRKGRHLFVATISVREIIDILHARRLLEGEAARIAATKMDQHQVTAIRTAVQEMTDAGDVEDEQHWRVDDMLHLGIADAAENGEIRRMIGALRQRTRMFGLRRIPGRFDIGRLEHLRILDAIEARNPAAAAQAMCDHIDHAQQAIVALLQQSGGHGG